MQVKITNMILQGIQVLCRTMSELCQNFVIKTFVLYIFANYFNLMKLLKCTVCCQMNILKFIYSEKATKFCEILHLLLTTVHTVKSKGKILQNFVAFSEYMNFRKLSQLTKSLFHSIHFLMLADL